MNGNSLEIREQIIQNGRFVLFLFYSHPMLLLIYFVLSGLT